MSPVATGDISLVASEAIDVYKRTEEISSVATEEMSSGAAEDISSAATEDMSSVAT